MIAHYFFILVGAVLVNNVVLVRILGLCPFMGVSKKLETAFGMGAATTFVLTLGTGASWVIDRYLLIPFDLRKSIAFGMILCRPAATSTVVVPPAPLAGEMDSK